MNHIHYQLYAVVCLFLAGCSAPIKKPTVNFTIEPSVERAVDILSTTKEGKKLVRFIEKNHVTAAYFNFKGPWSKLMPKKRRILIPSSAQASDIVVALLLARQAHIYMTYHKLGLSDILVEQEELASLVQAHLALEIGFGNSDAESSGSGAAVLAELCPYLLTGSHRTMEVARRNALEPNPEYARPLESIASVTDWIGRTQKAVIDGSIAQLRYKRDLERVRKNAITTAEAMKNDADFRALAPYEVFRVQRKLYQNQMRMLSDAENMYRSGIKADASWRRKHNKEIQKGLNDFSSCTLK